MSSIVASAMFGQASGGGLFTGPEVQWASLLPPLILLGGALVLLVTAALSRRKPLSGSYALFTVVVAASAAVVAFFLRADVRDNGPKRLVGGAMMLDQFTIFVTIAICASIMLTALIANDYLQREDLDGPEVYGLMLLCAVGGIVMAGASDLIVLFLGLETLSLALYVMAASHTRRSRSQESALKYFVLGGFSSAFFLYGIALIYGSTGSTNYAAVADYLDSNVLSSDGVLLAGIAMLLVGLAFKVAAVPFHSWVPDVYEGSPSPVSGFMASAAKAAGFAGLLRAFTMMLNIYAVDWKPLVYALAIATLAVGAVLAVVQTNVKRMLAYSSINHAGFILIGLQANSARGTSASLFYLLAYTFMVVGSFGVVTLVARKGDDRHDLDDYRGLSKSRPVLAFVFTVCLLAQAGVPLTTGFLAKFYVIGAAVDAHSYGLAIVAMLTAVVSAFLYLRIIVSMYLADAPGDALPKVRVPFASGLALTVAVAFTLVVGFLPSAVIDFARDAVPVLTASR
ncbi:MAG: NADH-quinone oxidoreductase subunit N [Acidimicrobiia bacterium]